MSKSWIVMSRKIPPDPRTYSNGGGAGSRLEIRASCGSPLLPPPAGAGAAAPGGRRLPDLTARDGRGHRGVRRIEAPVEADLERHAGGIDGGEGAVDLAEVQRHRLLAEDRLSGLGGRDDQVRVGRRRAAD